MTIPAAVLASLVAALIATLGLAVVARREAWARANAPFFTAFAAGVLVTTALTLFPEALAATEHAPMAALVGYLLLYGLNLLFKEGGAATAAFAAIALHSFLDGIEYGVLFDHDGYTGLIASLGLIAHEFAEGVILFAVLRTAGLRTATALIGAFVGAAVTTPLGALASQPLLDSLSAEGMGLLLAGAAGALLYVGATHLPIHLAQGGRRGLISVYLIGVGVALGLHVLHPEDAAHGPQDEDRRSHAAHGGHAGS